MFICNKGLGPIKFLGVFGEPPTWLVQLSIRQPVNESVVKPFSFD